MTDEKIVLEVKPPGVCPSRHVMLCLLNMHHTLEMWVMNSVFTCGRHEQCLFFSCSDVRAVCVAGDTFIQTKEAPVAVLSVASNSRGMTRCCTKDEMFSLRNHNPPKAIVATCHANVAAHKMYCTVFATIQGFTTKCSR